MIHIEMIILIMNLNINHKQNRIIHSTFLVDMLGLCCVTDRRFSSSSSEATLPLRAVFQTLAWFTVNPVARGVNTSTSSQPVPRYLRHLSHITLAFSRAFILMDEMKESLFYTSRTYCCIG